MKQESYTTGPWRVRTDNDSYIRIDAGGEITSGYNKGDPDYDNNGQTLISEDFYLSDSSMKDLTKAARKELIANYTLAAAAPELLEACQAALMREDISDGELGDQIRAAIAKAKGEAA